MSVVQQQRIRLVVASFEQRRTTLPCTVACQKFQNIIQKYEIFTVSHGNFKTRDFSPLIERVLAGVA